MPKYFPLLGRVFLSFIFLMAGMNKIFEFSGTQGYMAAFNMPLTSLFLVGAIVVEVVGALMIMFGYKTKWAAIVLMLFMIPTTLIFHMNFADQNQMIHFMKNMSMIGGLLYIAYHGAGSFSLDARGKK